jgi:hypothetical protein
MSRTQNFEPPERREAEVYICRECGEPILEGEEYVTLPRWGEVHLGCVYDIYAADWLTIVGANISVAEVARPPYAVKW